MIHYVLLTLLLLTGEDLMAESVGGRDTDPKTVKSKLGWVDVPMEKRCEAFWAFVSDVGQKHLSGWVMSKPKCEIAGGSSGEWSWALEFTAIRHKTAIPMRISIQESLTLKPEVAWCLIRNNKVGCAAPWESAFARGTLFANPENAKAAYSNVTKMSHGFLLLVTDVDGWVGRPGGSEMLFGVTYEDWIKGWVAASRSLPVGDKPFVADYKLDPNVPKSGNVQVKEMPKSLQECLKCPKAMCDGVGLTFTFSGLSLRISREITGDERAEKGQKVAMASWIMLDQTPFTEGKGRWPMLCGEHRFNIQKF
jgi:hypothetical protein